MPMISGSDGFLGDMPGICAFCFAAQTRNPHPPWYYCAHSAQLAIKRESAWEIMRVAPDDLALVINEAAKD